MTTTPPTEQANQMPPCPWGHTNIMRTPAGEVFCGYGTCPIYLVKIDPAKWSRRSAAEGQAAQAAIDHAYQCGLFDAATECEGVVIANEKLREQTFEKERRNKIGKIILGAKYCITAIRERARVAASPPTAPHEPHEQVDDSRARWIVRYKSRVITGGWEESLFYQEENARGFASEAGKGVTIQKYVPAHQVSAPQREGELK